MDVVSAYIGRSNISKQFDMEIFLAEVLTGSDSTRQHHVCQAEVIRAVIAKHWHLDSPGWWQKNTSIGF